MLMAFAGGILAAVAKGGKALAILERRCRNPNDRGPVRRARRIPDGQSASDPGYSRPCRRAGDPHDVAAPRLLAPPFTTAGRAPAALRRAAAPSWPAIRSRRPAPRGTAPRRRRGPRPGGRRGR